MKKLFRLMRGREKNVHLRKIWMTMKLTMALFFLAITQMVASEAYSQSTKMTLQLSDASVKEVLNRIEEKSEFFFLYNSKLVDVDRKVNVDAKNQKIDEILSNLFGNTDVVFTVVDRQIVLTNKSIQTGFMMQSGQQVGKQISGKVSDSSGAPVPGATVVVKGTTVGVTTDNEGKFSLLLPADARVLVFSFIGMKTQDISIANKTLINLVMQEEAIALDEVVAIGYGTIRRKDLTGSVSSVSGSALKDIPVTSAAQAITGRIAGVQVTKTEGSPDAEIKIRIRGGGSLTQDNSPLYIVDGFPVSNINDIAPSDIESIDVLKDASSTAIYGARGANGVILITTKNGFDGKGKVSYNMYYGVKEITKTFNVLNPYEYVFWQYEAYDPVIIQQNFGDFQDFKLYKQMTGTNWQNEVFGRTGTTMYHNIAVTGGSKTSKYNISLTRNDDKEVMLGSEAARTNLTVKTTNKISDWLSIDLNTRLSDANINGAGTYNNSRLADAVQFRPVNGTIDYVDYNLTQTNYEGASAYVLNPVKQTTDDYRRQKNLSFSFDAAATIRITKDLSYRFDYGTQYGVNTDKRFYGLGTGNVFPYGEQPMANSGKTDIKSYRLANVLTYTKRDFLPGHNLTAMVGEELNSFKSEYILSSAKYFPKYIDAVSALSMMTLGVTDPIVTADNPAIKTSSFFGRVSYDYKGRYLASATIRADGSSKFAQGNQWGYFPSVALAWRLSDENFLKETKNWLTNLKLRTSYGESGNNRITDNAWKKTFYVTSGTLFMEGNETSPTASINANSVLSNPKLKWETTVTRNIGLDFGFFKQRLNGSVEVYKNTTKDLLINNAIPANSGYASQWQNIGQTSNKGLEVSLNGVLYEKKDFRLSMSFNIAFNKNRIDNLGGIKEWTASSGFYNIPNDYLIKEGEPVGMMYGYVTEGMYSISDFDYNATTGAYKLKPGVPDDSGVFTLKRFGPGALKLKDQNNDGVVNALDKVIIGNANPKHTGGFNLTAQYKGFDFSAFFNWVYGNNIYNANKINFTSYVGLRYYKNILDTFDSDHRFTWISKETGLVVTDPVQLAEMNKNATMWSPAMSIPPLHTWAIEDGSFLRLNNITLGYSLPKSLLQKFRIDQVRVYATANNIWTWTNYTGYDPEVDTQRSTPLTPGVDNCAYPRARTFTVGLNLTF
jgi:TonB-linked SusC/RagA family outer membrane protein